MSRVFWLLFFNKAYLQKFSPCYNYNVMIKTNYEKLNLMLEQMKILEAKYDIDLSNSFNQFSRQYYFGDVLKFKKDYFKFTLNLFEFNKPVQIVSNKKYEKMKGVCVGNNNHVEIRELYRGARDISHHHNLIFDDDYHPGVGDYFFGLFTANNFSTAETYANRKKENVLKLKTQDLIVADNMFFDIILSNLDKDLSNFPVSKEKIDDFIKFMGNQSEEDRSKFLSMLYDNISLFAVYLGFDCIFDQSFPSYVILNRGKIAISQKEADRIAASQFQPQ